MRARDGEFPIFGCRTDIEEQGIAMMLEIFRRCHFPKAASVGEDLAKGLGPDILALHETIPERIGTAGVAAANIRVAKP